MYLQKQHPHPIYILPRPLASSAFIRNFIDAHITCRMNLLTVLKGHKLPEIYSAIKSLEITQRSAHGIKQSKFILSVNKAKLLTANCLLKHDNQI